MLTFCQFLIEKFLGGNWKQWMVQEALNIIRDKQVSQSAIKHIPTMEQAKVFRSAVKNHGIPKTEQVKIAKEIAVQGIGSRDIPDLVAEHPLAKSPKKNIMPKSLPMLDDAVKEVCGLINTLHTKLGHISKAIDNIQSTRLKASLMRDGKELTKLMNEVFENET